MGRGKLYTEPPDITFLAQDYSKEFSIDADFDLLRPQYSGFVSEKCKKYLQKGGILVANNSDGDASLASIDNDFRLIAIVNRKGERFWFSKTPLYEYFVPRKDIEVTKDLIYRIKRGSGYTRSAHTYIFEKVN